MQVQGRGFSEYVEELRASGTLTMESAVIVLHGAGEVDFHDTDVTAMGREPGKASMEWPTQEQVDARLARPSTASAASFLNRAREELNPVFVIVKRPGNAFDYMSVGRAPHLDVVLHLQRVSKFHAYFLRESGDQFMLADAGSTNGTWIGTKRLAVRKPEQVRDGERIRLGPYAFTFHTPSGFVDTVRARSK